MLKNIKIRTMVIALVIFQLVLLSAVTIYSVKDQLGDYIDETSEIEARVSCENIQLEVDDLKERALLGAKLISEDPSITKAVAAKDHEEAVKAVKNLMKNMSIGSVSITDEEGNIIARGHSDKYGDNIFDQYNVQKALEGKDITNIEEAVVVKLSVRAGSPVYDEEGNIIGSIITSFRLDENEFVDDLKNKYGEDFTIFKGDERLTTTIKDDSGNRIVGTKASEKVVQKVLVEKQDYNGEAKVLNTPYYVHYKPLTNTAGETIGMLFAGKSIAAIRAQEDKIVNYIIIISVVLIVISIVFAFLLSVNIQNKIKAIINQTNNLINAAVQGKLDSRANPEEVGQEFREIPVGVNKLLDALITPLNVTAEYVDRISKGDIPRKITEEYYGDFNEIKNNFNNLIDVMDSLLDETSKISNSISEGKLDYRANSSVYSQKWGTLVSGINNILDEFSGPLNVTAEYVDRIAKGDIPPKITDEYHGDFNEIKNNLNMLIDVMGGLLEETDKVIEAVKVGKLDYRADGSQYMAKWGALLEGVNSIVDGFVSPLNVTAEYIDRIAKGDMPEKITEEYYGDFNEIKNNINNLIDVLNDITRISHNISEGNLEDRIILRGKNDELLKSIDIMISSIKDIVVKSVDLSQRVSSGHIDARIDTKGFSGDYLKIINELNGLANSFEDILDTSSNLMIADATGHITHLNKPVTALLKKSERGIQSKFSDFAVDKLKGMNIDRFHRNPAHNRSILDSLTTEPHKAKLQLGKERFELVITALFDNNNKKLGYVVQWFNTTAVNNFEDELRITIDKLNNGDLSATMDVDSLEGSYKETSQSINSMLVSITDPFRDAGEILGVMATGDLRARIEKEYKGDLLKFKDDINKLGDSLSHLINELMETVETTASSALEISSTAESLAAATQEQSSQADEVASAVEEMSRTVTENAQSASNTADMALNNGKIATEGGSVVEQTVQKMKDIASVVQNSSDSIKKLGESSKEIGEIISVIDDIADQTNLLALNAAIEAARAGEQGRGFAVVADEVRKLAERTTDATKKIADMIKGIQTETDEAVVAMSKGTDEVQSGIDLADKAGDSLNTILSSTTEVQDMINQIAAASEEQSATSEQISKNVVSISKVTSESAQRVEDVARTSEDLAKLTEHLKELMSQFKVDSNTSISSSQHTLNNNTNRYLSDKNVGEEEDLF